MGICRLLNYDSDRPYLVRKAKLCKILKKTKRGQRAQAHWQKEFVMKQIYENPIVLVLTLGEDLIKTSTGDDVFDDGWEDPALKG